MPKYFYKARSLSGEEKSGVKEAENLHQLAKILRQEGLILIKAETEKEKKKFQISFPSFGIPLSEKLFFTRNLRVMVSAGIALPRAILTLKEQVKNKKFKKVLEKIGEEIIKGEKFSDAISKFPEVFNEFYQSMIKVAEETGRLEEVLGILEKQMEKEHELRSRIIGALIYPAIVILAMIGVGALMLILVIPKIAEAFKELEIELPFTTKMVIFVGEFLSQKWYFLFFGLIFFIFSFFQFLKTKTGKKIFDFITLKIPIISGLVQKTNSAKTARNLSSLISGGVSLPRALEITANTLGNLLYKEVLISAVEKVKKGEKLSSALKPYQEIYPLTLIQMIEVGEETGETSEILLKLAEFYEEEISNITKNLVSIIEPVLLLLVGAMVGFFAVSIIQPIYSMLGAIK